MAQCSRYVLAIDQGTTSTRALVVDHAGHVVGSGQQEFRQILPRAGWVEHDPTEIWRSVRHVVAVALADAGVNARSLATIGITNQRETTVVWDRTTGEPVYNAIVWQDTRTQSLVDRLAADGGAEEFAERTGLMPASYFAGPKAAWILDHVEGARARAEAGELAIGTIDSWLLWQLTGGAGSGVHATDVTNASRTMLMNIDTLDWNEELAQRMGVPVAALPTIRSSSEEYGVGRDDGLVSGVPICGILGDQQAATYGQACFAPGMAKNTYGTGNFMLLNTGTECLRSEQGLLTTVAYKIGDAAPVYALEGSIAVTGSLVQWVRDNLGLVRSAAEIEGVAAGVADNGGAYFVPAFSGLFAPYWRPDARGALVGLTRYVDKRHLARAVLEATAYQTRDVVKAMLADADDLDLDLCELRVDGGMTVNNLLMQFQSDILDVAVVRPENTETTALGAAYAAGVAVGFWEGEDEIAANWTESARWEPAMEADERERLLRNWDKALTRSFDWVDGDVR